MFNKHTAALLLTCTIQLNLFSAMKPVPVPLFQTIADNDMSSFHERHKSFGCYPLLSEGTTFSLLDFNKKFDSVLHQNIEVLRGKKYKDSTIEIYKAEVFDKHLVNLKKITTYAINEEQPFTTVTVPEELTQFPPFNNICLHYFPVPSNNHTLDKNVYTKIYRSTLALNKRIIEERGVAQVHLTTYAEKALKKLDAIYSQHFTFAIQPLSNTGVFAYTNYKFDPIFTLVYTNSDLENFSGNQSHCCVFPLLNTQSMVNLEYYVSAYYTVLHKGLQQMRYLGVPETALKLYENTLIVYLKQIIATYDQQLL